MGNLQSVVGGPLVVGDELYFYFNARPKPAPDAPNWDADYQAGLATLRRDGFASMDASGTKTLKTRPVKFTTGKYLFVNVNCPSGSLKVEVLDEYSQVISPFTLANCDAISADTTCTQLTWGGNDDLSTLQNDPIRFWFTLDDGSLYAFWVSPDASGASYGYVGAGGPGFTGPIDTVGTGQEDTTPPTPDPMTWASVPTADDQDSISMTATTATDPSGVQYYFDETSLNPGGSDSIWQASPSYNDDVLSQDTQYCYRVQARDKSANQNATAWSTPLAYATTLAGCSPTDCHVEAMVCSEQSCGGPNKNGVATVTIYDDCGDPVVGADVTGTFTGSFNEQVMDTTNQNGVAVLVSTGCLKKPTFQVCVDDVDHTLPYDSGDNLVTCCND